jgi:hypothetical protein
MFPVQSDRICWDDQLLTCPELVPTIGGLRCTEKEDAGLDQAWTMLSSFLGMFSFRKILGNAIVPISLLFDKYYPIID